MALLDGVGWDTLVMALLGGVGWNTLMMALLGAAGWDTLVMALLGGVGWYTLMMALLGGVKKIAKPVIDELLKRGFNSLEALLLIVMVDLVYQNSSQPERRLILHIA